MSEQHGSAIANQKRNEIGNKLLNDKPVTDDEKKFLLFEWEYRKNHPKVTEIFKKDLKAAREAKIQTAIESMFKDYGYTSEGEKLPHDGETIPEGEAQEEAKDGKSTIPTAAELKAMREQLEEMERENLKKLKEEEQKLAEKLADEIAQDVRRAEAKQKEEALRAKLAAEAKARESAEKAKNAMDTYASGSGKTSTTTPSSTTTASSGESKSSKKEESPKSTTGAIVEVSTQAVALRGRMALNTGALTVVQKAAIASFSTMGRKDGDVLFQKFMELVDPTPPDSVIKLWIVCCKKFSLRKSDFDKVNQNSLDASEKNMKSLQMTDAQIAKSAPRQTYIKNGTALKEYLTPIWAKNPDEKLLNWGNFMRHPYFVEYMDVYRKQNWTLKPFDMSLIYSNAYWMVAELKDAFLECSCRLFLIAKLVHRSRDFIIKDSTGRGRFTLIDEYSKLLAEESLNEKFGETTLPDSKDALDPILEKATTKELLDCAVMVDVKKLFQTVTVRRGRPRRGGTGMTLEHKNNLNAIISLMQVTIIISDAITKHESHFEDRKKMELSLQPGSTFLNLYYSAYSSVHGYIRQFKRLVFGNPGGKETRAVDMNNFDDLVKGTAYDTNWETVKKSFKMNF